MTRHKRNENISSLTVLLLGTLASGIIFTVLSLAFAFILFSFKDPASLVPIASMIALLVTGAILGFAIPKVKNDGGIVIALLSSLLFTLILLMIGLIVGKGEVSVTVFINYICFIAISFLFSLLGRRKHSRRKR